MSLRSSIRLQIIVPMVILSVTMVLVAQGLIATHVVPSLTDHIADHATLIVDSVHFMAEVVDEPSEVQRFVAYLGGERELNTVVFAMGSPPVIVGSSRGAWLGEGLSVLPPTVQEGMARAIGTQREIHLEGPDESLLVFAPLSWSRPATGVDETQGIVFVDLDTKDVAAQAQTLATSTTWLLLGLASLIAIVALFLVHRSVLKPCSELGAAMESRADGDTTVRSPIHSPDEIGRLGAQFDRMLDSLDRARDDVDRANRTKSEFLANMSHEIRTPMTAILGFAEELLEPDLSGLDRMSAAKTIRQNCEHLLQLLDDILDISKIEAGRLEVESAPVVLPQVLVDLRALMSTKARSKGLDLMFEVRNPIPECVESDRTRIRQILLNLLGNAIKFTERGTVILSADWDDDEEPRLVVEVSDTGIGMSGEQLSRIFDAFAQADASTTRRFGGTGLGLSISRALTHLLGGSLTATSSPGEGSTFRLELPLRAVPDARRVADLDRWAPSATQRRAGKSTFPRLEVRILVAEDGPDNQRLIRRLLEKCGCDVTLVENGKEAVDAILAEDSNFDLILMDMQMPIMDGYEATQTLRELDIDLPIIALTAHAMSGDREKCLGAGCDGYATKPVDRAVLFQTILENLQREPA
ncbi:MAG: response regulator [Planctomycetes bacterium]|nr:response regulator [Planctomycetota bacterium]